MSVTSIGAQALKAYGNTTQIQKKAHQQIADQFRPAQAGDSGMAAKANSFADTVTDSLKKVNELDEQKGALVESFASGERQNVHELMISLQKAGLAMNMTSAVRNKMMQAYQEIMRMPM